MSNRDQKKLLFEVLEQLRGADPRAVSATLSPGAKAALVGGAAAAAYTYAGLALSALCDTLVRLGVPEEVFSEVARLADRSDFARIDVLIAQQPEELRAHIGIFIQGILNLPDVAHFYMLGTGLQLTSVQHAVNAEQTAQMDTEAREATKH